jgi:Flp pilus assembly protein TadG
MRRFLKSLSRSERGAAVIEMALVAPFIATMVIGVVDLSNAFGRKLKCEQAAQRAIEKIMNTTANDTVEATLTKEAAEQAGVAESNVTVTFRVECNGSAVAATDCQPGEKMSQWIDVIVKDQYKPLFPVHMSGINSDGTYHVQGQAGIRTQ